MFLRGVGLRLCGVGPVTDPYLGPLASGVGGAPLGCVEGTGGAFSRLLAVGLCFGGGSGGGEGGAGALGSFRGLTVGPMGPWGDASGLTYAWL